MTSIGFIGLGNMGLPMSAKLAKAGHAVTGYDLVKAACDAAAEKGVAVASSAADAVADKDVVITMLPAGRHVLEAYCGAGGIIAGAQPGALFIDSSTIEVDAARQFHAAAAEAGFASLDAPVSGGVAGAEAATCREQWAKRAVPGQSEALQLRTMFDATGP